MARNRRLSILLAGYLPPPIGGVRVLFRQLVEDLQKDDITDIVVINLTGRRRGFLSKVFALGTAAVKILFYMGRVDVVTFHPTNRALLLLGPFVYVLSKMLKKPLVVRKFAGNYHEVYGNYPGVIQRILKRTVFQADICMFETRFLCDYFGKLCRRAEYYPNNRLAATAKIETREKARHFVFVSQMKRTKGVLYLFEISDALDANIHIDLYGPLGFDMSAEELDSLNRRHRAQYKGEVSPDKIIELLGRYDAVVLPTRRKSEGYPGIILEAYTCGLPVISSKYGAIPEIVNDSCGLLVEPGDPRQLREAILRLHADEALFRRLQRGALEQARFFDSRKWNAAFRNFCVELHEDIR
jgi:glycosyltransferase involved in cell wall biosynthesis